MVPCELNSMLGRYHDGELSAGERPVFEAHLPGCAPCTSELEQLRSIGGALRSQELPRASRDFVARLESLAVNVEDMSIIRFTRRLTGIAAAILVAATVQWVLHSHPAPASPVAIAPSLPVSDEHRLLDPELAAKDAGTDNNAALIDMGPIAEAISGGHP